MQCVAADTQTVIHGCGNETIVKPSFMDNEFKGIPVSLPYVFYARRKVVGKYYIIVQV